MHSPADHLLIRKSAKQWAPLTLARLEARYRDGRATALYCGTYTSLMLLLAVNTGDLFNFACFATGAVLTIVHCRIMDRWGGTALDLAVFRDLVERLEAEHE